MSSELRRELMGLGKQAAISIGLFVMGFLMGGDLSQAVIVACVPYGWKVLNRITPNIFVWMPFVGWIIYFIVKIAIAAVVGVFVMAFVWIRCIARVVIAYRRQTV